MDALLLVVLVLVSIPVYFAPSFIAVAREHHQLAAIVALNLFLGWTFLGWVISLVWALTAVAAQKAAPRYALPNVENIVTAQGAYKYQVWAYRKMDQEELRKVVWKALESGELKQPKQGGTATLMTRIGQ